MKEGKSGGRGTGNGEKQRREGEQEGESCLSSKSRDTTVVWLQRGWSNEREK